MKKIYIASPYSKGDKEANVRRQMETANRLLDAGLAPFIPLLFHYQHTTFPRPYEDWLELDIEWLRCCDYILRLAGESEGADIEVGMAVKLNIPIYYSVDDLIKELT